MIASFNQSCQVPIVESDQLVGKWDVIFAARNQKATGTLEDAYFQFLSDTTFETNIFSGVATYAYEMQDDGFQQIGEPEVFYKISEFKQDTLILNATINDYDFLFVTVRDTMATSIPE